MILNFNVKSYLIKFRISLLSLTITKTKNEMKNNEQIAKRRIKQNDTLI